LCKACRGLERARQAQSDNSLACRSLSPTWHSSRTMFTDIIPERTRGSLLSKPIPVQRLSRCATHHSPLRSVCISSLRSGSGRVTRSSPRPCPSRGTSAGPLGMPVRPACPGPRSRGRGRTSAGAKHSSRRRSSRTASPEPRSICYCEAGPACLGIGRGNPNRMGNRRGDGPLARMSEGVRPVGPGDEEMGTSSTAGRTSASV